MNNAQEVALYHFLGFKMYCGPEDIDQLVDMAERLDQGHLLSGREASLWGGNHKEHMVVWPCRLCPDPRSPNPSVIDTAVYEEDGWHWHSWRYPPVHKVDRAMRKKIRQAMLQAGYNKTEIVDPFYRRLAH